MIATQFTRHILQYPGETNLSSVVDILNSDADCDLKSGKNWQFCKVRYRTSDSIQLAALGKEAREHCISAASLALYSLHGFIDHLVLQNVFEMK